MIKKLTLLLVMLCAYAAMAQVRTGITAGPAFNLKGKNNDTAFFGNSYFNTQIKAGLHKGRIGLVLTGGMITQEPASGPERLNLNANGAVGELVLNGGKVRNTFFAAGPELCFPFGAVRLTGFFAAGVGWLHATTVTINRNTTPDPVYQNELDKNTTGITRAGIGFNYYFNKHLAFTLNTEHLGYKLKYNNLDRRRQGSAIISVTEKKNLIAVAAGITYKL